jgi:hypothetical protein
LKSPKVSSPNPEHPKPNSRAKTPIPFNTLCFILNSLCRGELLPRYYPPAVRKPQQPAVESPHGTALHCAVATGVQAVSFCAALRATSAAAMRLSSSLTAPCGTFYALAFCPRTLFQLRAMLNWAVRLAESQSVLWLIGVYLLDDLKPAG